MPLPTEPIGSIPRPAELIDGVQAAAEGRLPDAELQALFADAVRDTIAELEATGSPVLTDGEQRKPSFASRASPPRNGHGSGCTRAPAATATRRTAPTSTTPGSCYLPVERLGTTDDCGFSPFGDDTSTARETAFEKIRSRVQGTALASRELGV